MTLEEMIMKRGDLTLATDTIQSLKGRSRSSERTCLSKALRRTRVEAASSRERTTGTPNGMHDG